MNTKHPLLLLALASCLALGACSKSSSEDAPSSASPSDAPSNSQALDQPALDQPALDQPASNQPAPSPRPSLAPTPVFTPDKESLQQAFAAALFVTYQKTPPSPTREQWLSGEELKIRSMQVSSCTISTPGTASVCQVQINNSPAQVKIMLTQSGWRLVL